MSVSDADNSARVTSRERRERRNGENARQSVKGDDWPYIYTWNGISPTREGYLLMNLRAGTRGGRGYIGTGRTGGQASVESEREEAVAALCSFRCRRDGIPGPTVPTWGDDSQTVFSRGPRNVYYIGVLHASSWSTVARDEGPIPREEQGRRLYMSIRIRKDEGAVIWYEIRKDKRSIKGGKKNRISDESSFFFFFFFHVKRRSDIQKRGLVRQQG